MSQPPFILVCDDNQPIARSIVFLLERAGYRAQAVSSVLDCVAVARQTPPSLILMDVMMPGMDGATATELMKDIPGVESVPIVLVSALPEALLKERAREAGAADYLPKPFRKDRLLDVVHCCTAAPAPANGLLR